MKSTENFGGKYVDRDEVTVEHFQGWIDWSRQNDVKLDFNSTSFPIQRAATFPFPIPTKASVISGLSIRRDVVPFRRP